MIEEFKDIIDGHSNPSNFGTASGAFHRIFINMKNLIGKNDTDSVIKEIKYGENILIDIYKELLRKKLPEYVKEILITQLENIEDSLKKIDIESLTE
jgi:uncharacterized protein (TIGR02284 family)